LAFWLAVGLSYGLLQGWIVPRIDDFRPRLEIEASRALGIPVQIGNIRAYSRGLVPSFELTEVSLLDREGRIALRLPRVVAALSPRSLWSLGFEQLVIDGPELDIRRTADGQFQIAGLDLPDTAQGHSAFADWAFEQTELVLRGGLLRWTDETIQVPPLVFTDVVAVLRNPGQRHLMRIDATPPTAWGERFSVRAQLRQPLLSGSRSSWKTWTGQLYSEFSRADVSQVQQYISLDPFGLSVNSGQGALRVWADLTAGQLSGVTADVALTNVNARLARELQPLKLDSVSGRFGGQQRYNGYAVQSEGLSFKADDGLLWPGGNVSLARTDAEARLPAKTVLKADKLDLAALARIAKRLPLDEATHALLESFAPNGLVEHVEAAWQGELSAPVTLTARGRVTGLALAAAAASASTPTQPLPGRPGVQNATIDFNLTQDGGQAQLKLNQGMLEFPGIFEQPRLLFNSLSSDVLWKHDGPRLELQLKNLRFANADAEGQAEVRWNSATPAGVGSVPSSHPGMLDLQGSFSRSDASQVHRYLPLVLPESARHYVRDAVQQGRLSNVKVKVKGDLLKLPFANPKNGEFLVTANASNVRYAYVPQTASTASTASSSAAVKPWPKLEALQGELVFNRQSFEVRAAQGRVADLDGLQLTRGSARIQDLSKPVVEVNTLIKGPLAKGLQFVNTSPVSSMLGDALKQSTANGSADYTMRLLLPLSDLGKSSLQGSLTLPGNDVQFTPNTPVLGRLKGALAFTENSFRLSSAQARILGGDVRFDGGMRASAAPASPGSNTTEPLEAPILFRGQGMISAEGLQQAQELGIVATLANQVSGTTTYNASLGFRRGNAELSVSSSLQGMALNLPAPLRKAAGETLPLQFDQVLLRDSLAAGKTLQDQLSLTLGQLASVRYVRDLSGSDPRVLRGSIAVGLQADESVAQPANVVTANVNLQHANVDAWRKVLEASASPSKNPAAADYLPSVMALRATELTFEGYQLNNVVLGASRQGTQWRANMDADELSGYVELGPSNAAPGGAGGRLYARLSRLRLGASTARDVETLLKDQPAAVPALDIVVEDMELKGKKLGRVEVEAVNRSGSLVGRDSDAREWRLNKLNIISPDATFSATGNWASVSKQAQSRRVLMNFKLDINNSGDLLKRLGMDDLIRRGKGKLEGQVSWLGSPLSLDYPSLGGQFHVNVESGQFLKAEPGIAKLLGVLSLQALPRRLTLDFRDVFSEGFAFDFVRGDVTILQGQARTNNLQMKGLSAAVLMEGSADIARETQDLRVVVIPEINAGTASLIATAINPAIGLGSFLAQLFFSRPLTEAATQEFHIDGPWSDPHITRVERKPVSDSP
jgi:uncharacterized protein (TIGR02099 family)